MEKILLILFIIAIVSSFITIIAESCTTHYLKKQNKLLWEILKESNNLSKELIKINLENDGGNNNE